MFLKGRLEHGRLLQKLNDYDVFISHPIAVSYVAEAFHLGNMEAMASGLPVITAACGGVPWVVGDHAKVVPQKDVNAIVNCVLELKDNPSELQRLSEEGRSYVERTYSLDVIVKQWLSLLGG